MPRATTYHRNRKKYLAKATAWHKANPESVRATNRKQYIRSRAANLTKSELKRLQKYGLTVEQRDELFDSNNGLCHICNNKPSECVDHCHTSGGIRGALCANCNLMLGHAHDNPAILRAAASYLETEGN